MAALWGLWTFAGRRSTRRSRAILDENRKARLIEPQASGRRGTPLPLDVPGEDLEKVVYRLIDPEQYAGRSVLVVGGGDSALEAAARLAEQPGTDVTISYRGKAYSRARSRNREQVRELVEARGTSPSAWTARLPASGRTTWNSTEAAAASFLRTTSSSSARAAFCLPGSCVRPGSP